MNKSSFTLIEILVVATIIGILAAGAAVTYSQFTKQSRDARRKADMEQIRSALEMFRSNNANGYYILADDAGDCSAKLGYLSTYLPGIPSDPKSGYEYYCSLTTLSYVISAKLENDSTVCVAADACGTGIDCSYSVGPYGKTCPP